MPNDARAETGAFLLQTTKLTCLPTTAVVIILLKNGDDSDGFSRHPMGGKIIPTFQGKEMKAQKDGETSTESHNCQTCVQI
jgi:hypothetical protein